MEKTIPCEVCGKPTTYLGTKRCNNCWEVEVRLPCYLQSKKGRLVAFKSLISEDLANAIIDMENISYYECQGPEHVKAWEKLVSVAEIIANRKAAVNRR